MPHHAGRVLDLGGGIGATSLALKDAGRADSATLIDQVADDALPGIDRAEAVDLEDRAALQTLLADAGPFDTVLCLDVLEHLVDPWGVVRALDPHIAAGGALVVSVPNIGHHSVTLPLLRGRFDYREQGILDRTHLRWFTRDGAVALAGASGMRVEEVKANIWHRRARWIDRASFGALCHHLAQQYIVRARKA